MKKVSRYDTLTPTLKRLLFPDFRDSEMGHDYVLEEETRDPEHP